MAIISMYYFDNKKHKLPHIHVKSQGEQAVFTIPEGKILEGSMKQVRENLLKHGLKFIKMS